MPNPYFNFKQFSIWQDKCAMKVGTDGVLLGAWVEVEGADRVLDIGTGTGLISIMVAQRNPASQVTGVEIDLQAAHQAQSNAQNSPWSDRLNIVEGDVADFSTSTDQRFDLIVSNPPFFEPGCETTTAARSVARSTTQLDHGKLVGVADRLLTEKGKFGVILPTENGKLFIESCEKVGLNCLRKTIVKPTPQKAPKRILMEFGRTSGICVENELVIEEGGRHQYSGDYIALTKAFYLKM